jgi:hypothetical protein
MRPDEMIRCGHCHADVPLTECESTYCGSVHVGCGALEAHAAGCALCRRDFIDRGLITDGGAAP